MRNLRIFCVVVVFMVPRFSPAFILLNKIHENDVKDHPKGFGTAKHAIIIGTFCNLIAFFSFTLVFFDIVFLIGTIMNKLIPILLPIHERSTNVQAQILSKNVSKTEPRRRLEMVVLSGGCRSLCWKWDCRGMHRPTLVCFEKVFTLVLIHLRPISFSHFSVHIQIAFDLDRCQVDHSNSLAWTVPMFTYTIKSNAKLSFTGIACCIACPLCSTPQACF